MRESIDVLRSLKRYLALSLPGYNIILDGEEGTAKRPMAVVKTASPENVEGPHHSHDIVQAFDAFVYPTKASNAQEGRVVAGGVQTLVTRLLADGLIYDPEGKTWARADGIGRGRELPLYDYGDKTWKQGVDGYAETRVKGDVVAGATSLEVDSATDLGASGAIYVGLAGGGQPIAYTGKTSNKLTGVTGVVEAIPDDTLVRQYGDRLRPDFARMLDLSVDTRQSPDDETLYTVLAEVRLGWRRGSLLPSNGEMAESVHISFN